uniref:J domain-containing protein n=1 Tax=Ananas comosus var. bracteatus TaxID=296719 RepID=A0A6V7QB59_ANACO|nr:unnamed protein product [Ananas comosus var. bracteatus]
MKWTLENPGLMLLLLLPSADFALKRLQGPISEEPLQEDRKCNPPSYFRGRAPPTAAAAASSSLQTAHHLLTRPVALARHPRPAALRPPRRDGRRSGCRRRRRARPLRRPRPLRTASAAEIKRAYRLLARKIVELNLVCSKTITESCWVLLRRKVLLAFTIDGGLEVHSSSEQYDDY